MNKKGSLDESSRWYKENWQLSWIHVPNMIKWDVKHLVYGTKFCDVYSNSWKPTEEDITFEINKVRLLSIGQPMRFTLVFGKSVEASWTRIKHNTFFRVVFCYVLCFWLFALNTIYLTNKELKIHYRDSAWINLVMIILKWHV